MIQDLITIGILSVPIGFFVVTFVNGKLPVIGGGGYRNRVLFGDRNVNPTLLVGFRARMVGFSLGAISALIVFVLYVQNQIMVGQYFNSILSIVIGVVIGMIWYKYALGCASGKN